VSKRLSFLLALLFLSAGCNLSGDITPPPALATAQAAQLIATGTPVTTPTPTETPPAATATAQPASDPAAETPPPQEFGAIRGQVINGTSGQAMPAGFEVTLRGLDGEQEIPAITSAVGAEGAFLFEGLAIVPGRLYWVTAEHQGLAYRTEPAHLMPGDQPVELPLTIYDVTTDAELVRVERLHLIFEFSPQGVINVLEVWLLSNLGENTVAASEDKGILEITLPEGAGALEVEAGLAGERITATEGGIADNGPLLPGVNTGDLTFAFQLAYERGLTFTQSVDREVVAVVVLLPEEGPDVSGDGLQETGVRQIGDESWRSYEAGPLSSGESLRLDFSGRLSVAGGTGGSTSLSLIIGSGALGLALIVGGLLWYRRTGASDEIAAEDESLSSDPAEARDGLLQALADLDDGYESGEVAEASYRRKRAKLKRQALALLKKDDDQSS
jgi:hypothetical protein